MPDTVTISIDAMGGDNAPAMVVDGLALALKARPELRFRLYGDQAKIKTLLTRHSDLASKCEVVHTDDVITNDAKPAVALRGGRNSSMRLAVNAVGDGQAQAVVSAGNTGALMAIAKFVLKTLPGIDRPAISTSFPSQRGDTVMLDLGANIECDADNLVQFAVMGEVFARHILGLEKPSIGLLNVGSEDIKGREAVRQAAAILKSSPLPIRFHGFVEGDDIGAGTVDVVVTDGFTGNIALKTAEGTVKLLAQALRDAINGSWRGKIGAWMAKPALMAFRRRMDPRRYNGALLVGLNGICIKSHGGTDAVGFANAVRVAADLIRRDFNERIKEDLERLISGPRLEPPVAAAS
ncbi:MAG: phosphate acyltransferase PlsX [Rhodospirillales bacterium]|nr:phosphate acyltransferase PlsX [Rhodospirillales bacterium]